MRNLSACARSDRSPFAMIWRQVKMSQKCLILHPRATGVSRIIKDGCSELLSGV
jgi:hypothetical protein